MPAQVARVVGMNRDLNLEEDVNPGVLGSARDFGCDEGTQLAEGHCV